MLSESQRKRALEKELAHRRLLTLLRYEPCEGSFYWLKNMCAKRPAGSRAGWMSSLGYWRIESLLVNCAEHTLVWLAETGRMPITGQIDHIDGDPLNNRFSNLREATHVENMRNRPKQSNNTSGFKGVRRERNRWAATIQTSGRKFYLGSFDTPEEAHCAYAAAAKEMHGDFAKF